MRGCGRGGGLLGCKHVTITKYKMRDNEILHHQYKRNHGFGGGGCPLRPLVFILFVMINYGREVGLPFVSSRPLIIADTYDVLQCSHTCGR
jgi:hypothetical protein